MKQYILNALLAIAAILAPARPLIYTSFLLIILDLITGLYAAYRAGNPITSNGLKRSIVKVFIYEGAVVLSFLTQTYLTGAAIPVANIVAGLIGVTELVSVLENMNKIGGGDLLKAIIDKLNQTPKP